MPSTNLRPNNTASEDFVSFDIEASAAEVEDDPEDSVPAGLTVSMEHEGSTVEVFETDADEIRKFRDLVVAECDKALALLG